MRRLRTLGVGMLVLAFAAALVPGIAQAAAPTVYCVVSYGQDNPGNCDPQPDLNLPPYRGKLFPTSQPYGYGEKGILFVEGVATPGTSVTVTATDGTLSVSRTVEARLLDGAFKADLKVTELGVHAATGSNPFGHAVLTVIAVSDSNVDNAKSSLIDKYAVDGAPDATGTTKDTYGPSLRDLKFPPKHWCHTSGRGMGGRPGNFGGDWDGKCSSLQQDGVGAAPDVSWVACLEETSEQSALRSNLPAPFNSANPLRPEYCRTTPAYSIPRGEAQLSGLAEDDHADAFGHASEIASIVIQIKQGAAEIRTITAFGRINSTQGSWGTNLKINSFAPNYPGGTPYTIAVTATDAAGISASTTYGPITVYPW